MRDLSSTRWTRIAGNVVRIALTSAVQRNIPGVNLSAVRAARRMGTTSAAATPRRDRKRAAGGAAAARLVIDVA